MQWHESDGVEGLLTGKAPGPAPKLTDFQQDLLGALIHGAAQRTWHSGPTGSGGSARVCLITQACTARM